MVAVLYILVISTSIQLFYFLFFYARILWIPIAKETVLVDLDLVRPPVSIIVCAHNEFENLKRLIPTVLQQQYEKFELIIADDRSEDGSFEYFEKKYAFDRRFKIFRIAVTKEGQNAKKYALTCAIEQAEYETILLTDADCTAVSDLWVASMVKALGKEKEIVLGYSPYAYRKGFLNILIRYETLYTAIQYFSFALAGVPYMGVGRNLLYKKRLFVKNKGFSTHINRTGGDDDLFIRDVAQKDTVGICVDKEAHIVSIPKETYFLWFLQKRRHLSAGTAYKWTHKILLGAQISAQLLFYIGLGSLFCFDYPTAFLFLMIRSLVFVVIFALIARKLGDKYKWWWLLLFVDFIYTFNNLIVSISLVTDRKIKWS